MRARSAKQRFPVAQWVQSLDDLQTSVIKIHKEEASGAGRRLTPRPHSGFRSHSRSHPRDVSRDVSRETSLERPSPEPLATEEISLVNVSTTTPSLSRTFSLGVRTGPGHNRAFLNEPESDNRMSGIDESDSGDRNMMDGSRGLMSSHDDNEITITQEEAEPSLRSELSNMEAQSRRSRDQSPAQRALEARLDRRGRHHK